MGLENHAVKTVGKGGWNPLRLHQIRDEPCCENRVNVPEPSWASNGFVRWTPRSGMLESWSVNRARSEGRASVQPRVRALSGCKWKGSCFAWRRAKPTVAWGACGVFGVLPSSKSGETAWLPNARLQRPTCTPRNYHGYVDGGPEWMTMLPSRC